ncbi:DUF2199 domain-containing protein, partial [Actinoplanes philippinensis]|uniref:DUF2199 domain-containing protein n=1 Tax=Actinoplanes philippinensis TaxID=35752 RepID=UPI0033F25F21
CCGRRHPALPMAYHAKAPIQWSGRLPFSRRDRLNSDQCVIKGETYYVRGLIEIPVADAGDVLARGVWVSLSREDFARADKLWTTPGRKQEPPYSGEVSTELSLHSPSTVGLRGHVHTRQVGRRPLVELEPSGHPLAVEGPPVVSRPRTTVRTEG